MTSKTLHYLGSSQLSSLTLSTPFLSHHTQATLAFQFIKWGKFFLTSGSMPKMVPGKIFATALPHFYLTRCQNPSILNYISLSQRGLHLSLHLKEIIPVSVLSLGLFPLFGYLSLFDRRYNITLHSAVHPAQHSAWQLIYTQ